MKLKDESVKWAAVAVFFVVFPSVFMAERAFSNGKMHHQGCFGEFEKSSAKQSCILYSVSSTVRDVCSLHVSCKNSSGGSKESWGDFNYYELWRLMNSDGELKVDGSR